MGGSFKKLLSKSPVQTVGMRLMQGDSFKDAFLKNAGTPAQRGLHQWIHKSYGNIMGGGGGNYTPPKSKPMDMSSMFAQQNQMLANMKAQSDANAARQQMSNAQLAASAPRFHSAPPLAENKISDTNAPSDMPVDMYQPSSQQIAMNNFQMPDLSNIRFGGV